MVSGNEMEHPIHYAGETINSQKNHQSAGSQAPAWEPSREAPASRVIGTSEKDLKQIFLGTGSQAGAWKPAEQINQFSAKIERNVKNEGMSLFTQNQRREYP